MATTGFQPVLTGNVTSRPCAAKVLSQSSSSCGSVAALRTEGLHAQSWRGMLLRENNGMLPSVEGLSPTTGVAPSVRSSTRHVRHVGAAVCSAVNGSSNGGASASTSVNGDADPSTKGGYVYMMRQLDDVESLRDFLPGLEDYPNPLLKNKYFNPVVKGFFASDTDLVAKEVQVDVADKDLGSYFRLGGPRERVVYKPEEVKAAIVTCGGLCPGLNTVIREIVFGLWFQYGVRDIVGIKGGYRGFYCDNTMPLTPKVVSDWHRRGGTMLGTTRGGHDTTKIVDSIQDRGINQVFIIGGDGTQRGAIKIHEEVVRRGIKVSVVGIPKTVDNDVAIIDKSFGFDTAVETAQAAINAAHVEAESTPNGVGLVKVMGRYAGHIAMSATLASRDVDCCLIPEVPFYVDGPGGLFEFMAQRLRDNGHCVILLAEGAGQDLVAAAQMVESNSTKDASGNKLLLDTGLWLAHTLKDRWSKAKKRDSLNLKYIDPTYMVRAVPSNASDTIYCTLLAHTAIHGAMAGYTGFITGPVNSKYCYIPMQTVVSSRNQVNVEDRTWAWVRSVNNQPDFVPIDFDKQGTNVPASEKTIFSQWVAPAN